MYYGLVDDLIKRYLALDDFISQMGQLQEALRKADDKDRLAQQLYDISMEHSPDSDLRAFALEILAAARAGYNDLVLDIINFFLLSRDNTLMFGAIASVIELPMDYRVKVYHKILEIPLHGMSEYVNRSGSIFIKEFKDIQEGGSGI